MRIMVLSPYDNAELRSHLEFKEYGRFVKFVVEKLGLSRKIDVFKDTAPWVGTLIEELEKRPDVELFSVSPHIKLRKRIESFKQNHTTYFFYSSDYSSALRLIKNYRLWKLFQNCSSLVKRITKKIRPDVIILFGTENPTTSVPILSLLKYPILCVCQTVYNNPERANYSQPNKLIQQLELDILHQVSNYGTGSQAYYDMLKHLNPNIKVLRYSWPSTRFPDVPEQKKMFDFVNFAFTMDIRKGDEDCIKALSIVKKEYPNVTLNITGGFSLDRKRYLEKVIKDLGLNENVSFTPFFEKHEDMIKHVMQSRFAVLPIKLDLVSTTVKEAMYYKIPVVTNRTKGTPALNKEKQCVLLAEIGDVDSLAYRMLELMQNTSLAETLKINGHEHQLRQQMKNTEKMDNLINILEAVCEEKKGGIPIPQELLLH